MYSKEFLESLGLDYDLWNSNASLDKCIIKNNNNNPKKVINPKALDIDEKINQESNSKDIVNSKITTNNLDKIVSIPTTCQYCQNWVKHRRKNDPPNQDFCNVFDKHIGDINIAVSCESFQRVKCDGCLWLENLKCTWRDPAVIKKITDFCDVELTEFPS